MHAPTEGPNPMARLQDKVALITGAARGIGAAIARAYVDEGARVWVTDIVDDAGAAFAASLGANATYRHLDVTNEAEWAVVSAAVMARDGRLDVLVNNAGITGLDDAKGTHDPEHCSLEEWRAVHRVNLDGTFLGCKYAIRAMRPAGRGSIINLSSRSGVVGIPGAAAYASSKAAIRNHTKSVALYCAGEGLAIRCNSLHPAAVLTPMWDAMLGTGPDREARMQAMVADTPLKRFGRPEEVAAVAVMLASDECTYMTGAELTLDGGILAGSAASPRSR
jgi:NAD(P)-dependent dehydrogenase (short-subunit alcohol dehydrogenase family)